MKKLCLYIFMVISIITILACSDNKRKQQEEICQKAVKGAELFIERDKEGEVLLKEVWEYFLEHQEKAMHDSEYGKWNASKTEITMVYGICAGFILNSLSFENMDDYMYIKELKKKNVEFYKFLYLFLRNSETLDVANMMVNKILGV